LRRRRLIGERRATGYWFPARPVADKPGQRRSLAWITARRKVESRIAEWGRPPALVCIAATLLILLAGLQDARTSKVRLSPHWTLLPYSPRYSGGSVGHCLTPKCNNCHCRKGRLSRTSTQSQPPAPEPRRDRGARQQIPTSSDVPLGRKGARFRITHSLQQPGRAASALRIDRLTRRTTTALGKKPYQGQPGSNRSPAACK